MPALQAPSFHQDVHNDLSCMAHRLESFERLFRESEQARLAEAQKWARWRDITSASCLMMSVVLAVGVGRLLWRRASG
jgi:hypothetical protein